MKSFDYVAPRSEAEAVEYLASAPGRTAVLAGGTDLMALMKKMLITPDLVVNIMEVPELKTIERQDDGGLLIGAAVTLDELLTHPYLEEYPAIGQAIRGINSMQFQAQGTIGGEICQRPQCWFYRTGQGLIGDQGRHVVEGDNRFHAIINNSGPAKFVSASRIAPALIALDARVRIRVSHSDETWAPAAEFFRTPKSESQRETVLGAGQLLTHIALPPVAGRRNATYEVRHGEGPDYPLAAAAAALRFAGSVVSEAKVVMGHVAPTPWISQEAARMLLGRAVNPEVAEAAGRAAVSIATPLSENVYKVQLAKVAVKRAVLLAAGLEPGGF